MNKLSFLLLLTLPTFGFSQIELPGYEILLDRETSRVGEGQCLVYGNVVDINGNPITQGLVVTTRYEKQTIIKPDGSFSFVISDKDSMVFVLGSNYQEISITHKFRSQHKVKLAVTTRYEPDDLPEKPVIYLYSKAEKDVSIKLNPTNGFLFSYPKYNNGWLVSIDSTGNLTHNGKTYPYLFWEGQKQKIELAKTPINNELIGFIIKTDTATSFFENQLSSMGLNRKESADFITYWGPRLSVKPYAFIQFMEKDAYEKKIASIEVEPQPQSMQRVFMVFQGLSSESQFENTYIIPQTFHPFERSGFTLIEWGGAEISRAVLTL
jgi:hypothetical protein